MAFRLVKGKAPVRWFPKKASVALAIGDLLYFDASGAVQAADATSGDHVGYCLKTITSSDSDYASTTRIPVQTLNADCVVEAEAGGALATSSVGTYYDLTDANTVDEGSTSKLVVCCVGYINASLGLFTVNALYQHRRIATT